MRRCTSNVPRSSSDWIDEPSDGLLSQDMKPYAIVFVIPSDAFAEYRPRPRLLEKWDAFMSPSEKS